MGTGKGGGKGGRRANQTGRPTQIPSGDGDKLKITAALGSNLLRQLRDTRPELAELSDQDLVRAAVWIASGQQIPSSRTT